MDCSYRVDVVVKLQPPCRLKCEQHKQVRPPTEREKKTFSPACAFNARVSQDLCLSTFCWQLQLPSCPKLVRAEISPIKGPAESPAPPTRRAPEGPCWTWVHSKFAPLSCCYTTSPLSGREELPEFFAGHRQMFLSAGAFSSCLPAIFGLICCRLEEKLAETDLEDPDDASLSSKSNKCLGSESELPSLIYLAGKKDTFLSV